MKTTQLKTSSRHKRFRSIFIFSIISIVLIAAGIFTLEKTGITNIFGDSKNIQTTEEATKNDPTSGTKEDIHSVDGVNANQNTDEVPYTENMSLQLSVVKNTNQSVVVSATISSPASKGICTFTFTKDGARPITRSVETTSNHCEQSIAEVEFEMTGVWQIEARYFADSVQVRAVSEVTI